MSEDYVPYFVQDGHAEAWRPWFAWHLVWIADLRWPHRQQRRVWFTYVLRRRFHCASWFMTGGMWFWQYQAHPNADAGERK